VLITIVFKIYKYNAELLQSDLNLENYGIYKNFRNNEIIVLVSFAFEIATLISLIVIYVVTHVVIKEILRCKRL
jgi:hypothetical protein